MTDIKQLNERVSAARNEIEARGETFYPGPSRIHLASFPPKERWDDWVELDSRAWPQRVEHHYMLVPTTCFNCESACGLLAYIDKDSLSIRKFEGNPQHPGSRGRNCAKGPATLNQVTDPDRILAPLKRTGKRGEGKWVQVSWDEALNDIAGRIRQAIQEDPGELRSLASWPEVSLTRALLIEDVQRGPSAVNGRAPGRPWQLGPARPRPRPRWKCSGLRRRRSGRAWPGTRRSVCACPRRVAPPSRPRPGPGR